VLGATEGKGLGDLTVERPKMMVPIAGRPILRRLADEFKHQGVNQITAVTGYCAQHVDSSGIETIHNADFETTGELVSLACALPSFTSDVIVCYGDLLFRSYILSDLLDSQASLTVVVDSAYERLHISGKPDYAFCTRADDLDLWGKDVLLKHISDTDTHEGKQANGRWIGILRAQGEGVAKLRIAIEQLQSNTDSRQHSISDLLNYMVDQHYPISVNYIHGHWLDVNTLQDLEHADQLTMGEQ
jgi:phosphoenolpyruvate phosphomutase